MKTEFILKTVQKNDEVFIPAICAKQLAIMEALSKSEEIPFLKDGMKNVNAVDIELLDVGDHKILIYGRGCPRWRSAEIIAAFPNTAKIKTIYEGTVEDFPKRNIVV